jgi:serine protease Do
MPRKLHELAWPLLALVLWMTVMAVAWSEPTPPTPVPIPASPAPAQPPVEKPPVEKPQPADSAKITVPKNLGDLRAIEAEVKKVVAKVLPSVVAVRVGNSQGSGVIVTPDGYVLTAGHVAGNPGQPVTVVFADGKSVKGKSLGIHRRADAGLVKITDPGQWPAVEMGKSESLTTGSWCVAAGHPLGYQEGRPPVIRVGRILRTQGPFLQTDCPLVAGDSGGPLFNLQGQVIGIHSRIAGSATMNFHVPVDTFREVWDRLAKGDDWEEPLPGRDSDEVKTVFQPSVTSALACVVRVKCDDKDAALGTVVGPDGWVLTKASELSGKITCRLKDGRELQARIVGLHPQFDLAMLKIDISGSPSITWNTQTPSVGQWVITPGKEDHRPLGVGVIGVPQRKIPAASGVLGVALGEGNEGGRVLSVLPDSAAQKAGLKVDDLITQVNGLSTHNQAEVISAIKRFRPGEPVKLQIKRGEETLEISATLSRLDTPATRKRDLQNRSAVGISARSDDFPMVLQHDTILRPTDCGGPLVDLSGAVIGVNIARGGRTETYAVPASILLSLMYDLMSGKLAPPKSEPKASPAPTVKSPTFHNQYEGEPGERPAPSRGARA